MNETVFSNAYIALKSTNSVGNNNDQVLVVEGTTDKQFMKKIVKGNVKVEDIPTFITANNAILFYNKSNKPICNNKKCIIDIINSSQNSFYSLVEVYGLVDKDFDTEENIKKLIKSNSTRNKLFVTSTHDLETLLIATDLTIFNNYHDLQNKIKTAIYYAYKIGLIKKILYIQDSRTYENMIKILINENGQYDDSKLHLSLKDKKVLEETYYYEDIDDLLSEGTINESDIFDIANGHDILTILNILCKDDANRYIKEANTENHRNRAFEFAIIKKYNTKYFDSKLQLYRNMHKYNII